MVSLVNSHTNATRIGWHLWEIDLRFAPGLPPGRIRSPDLPSPHAPLPTYAHPLLNIAAMSECSRRACLPARPWTFAASGQTRQRSKLMCSITNAWPCRCCESVGMVFGMVSNACGCRHFSTRVCAWSPLSLSLSPSLPPFTHEPTYTVRFRRERARQRSAVTQEDTLHPHTRLTPPTHSTHTPSTPPDTHTPANYMSQRTKV